MDSEILEVSEILSALADGRDSVEVYDEVRGSEVYIELPGFDTVNYQPAYPRKTIVVALRMLMENPAKVNRLLRELRRLGVLIGPMKTTRHVDGKKTQLEFWAINERLWYGWLKDHS